MIIVTGGEGFIGGNLITGLIKRGYFGEDENSENDIVSLDTKTTSIIEINEFLIRHAQHIKCIFHLGAITDTTEMNVNLFNEYNLNSSMFIWNICTQYNIPLIYASSAATYGDGSNGFDDECDIINLNPLNSYGWSKQNFDLNVKNLVKNNIQPPHWYGLKFFNVYGYGESHKGKMASVAFHLFNQLRDNGRIKLFKSHNPKYKDGEQSRDFICVDDIVDVCIWMFDHKPESGLYNVGTGKARTFNDLANVVFGERPINNRIIDYIDTPIEIRDKYQYFTEAKINKLRKVGYQKLFIELEEGVKKYMDKLQS